MTHNNNFMSLYGFAFVSSGLRRISFDITSHQKKKIKINVVFVKKHCELLYNCYHLIKFALFMSLYEFAFVSSGLWLISFDITSHPKKRNKKYMLFLLKKKNTAN